jgi:YfiH family protein
LRYRSVFEVRAPGDLPLYVHPDWAHEWPWLVQGTTGRDGVDGPYDLGWFGGEPVGRTQARWQALREAAGLPVAVHARQVHGAAVARAEPGEAGLRLLDGVDGHWTDRPGVALTVSVADCVPVALVDPRRRAIALLHAGWRGTAAGILDTGLRALAAGTGSLPRDVWMHLGPAICGACYNVGPEVHAALGLSVPATPGPVDLRTALADRATAAGLSRDRITVSAHCTRCGGGFFSHRAGHAGRQVGLLGMRADAASAA